MDCRVFRSASRRSSRITSSTIRRAPTASASGSISEADEGEGRKGTGAMAVAWKLDNLYHTVVNVRDLDESVAVYELLGFTVRHRRRKVDWPGFAATIL